MTKFDGKDPLLSALNTTTEKQIKANQNAIDEIKKNQPSKITAGQNQPDTIFGFLGNLFESVIQPVISFFTTEPESISPQKNTKQSMIESLALKEVLSWRDNKEQNKMISKLEGSVAELSQISGINYQDITPNEIKKQLPLTEASIHLALEDVTRETMPEKLEPKLEKPKSYNITIDTPPQIEPEKAISPEINLDIPEFITPYPSTTVARASAKPIQNTPSRSH